MLKLCALSLPRIADLSRSDPFKCFLLRFPLVKQCLLEEDVEALRRIGAKGMALLAYVEVHQRAERTIGNRQQM